MKEKREDVKRLFYAFFIFLLVFNVLPAISYLGDMWKIIPSLLTLIYPIIVIGLGIYEGYKNKLDIRYLLIVPVTFIPSIFIYYNLSAFIYCVIFTICSFLGVEIGVNVKKLMSNKK